MHDYSYKLSITSSFYMTLYSTGPNCGATVICPPSPFILANQLGESAIIALEDLILPYVILWDPLHQYSTHFQDGLQCNNCSGVLMKECWKQGQSAGNEPRLIHGVEHTIIVVSAVYHCQNGHTTSATSPSILQMVDINYLPFILFHRTGFTKMLVRSIIQLTSEGMTLAAIERYLKKMRQECGTSLLLQAKFELTKHHCNQEGLSLLSFPLNLMLNPIPSDDIIYKCYMVDFLQNRYLYDESMQQLTAQSYISLDHTFKVAANIGYKRSDGKWVTEYNSAFFVMNEFGQVMSWQLTKTTSINEVNSILKNDYL